MKARTRIQLTISIWLLGIRHLNYESYKYPNDSGNALVSKAPERCLIYPFQVPGQFSTGPNKKELIMKETTEECNLKIQCSFEEIKQV